MVPTFVTGDWIIAQRINHAKMLPKKWQRLEDQIVIAQVESVLQIKRVSKVELDAEGNAQLWLLGDNPDQSTDSRNYGWVAGEKIMAHYLLRYKRGRQ